jgi:diadenosine tetraphosphate (Ap4A) HIT family hydrolase
MPIAAGIWARASRSRSVDGTLTVRDDHGVSSPDRPSLPDFVTWPIFPFDGEFRVRERQPRRDADYPRDGEPGGSPCPACVAPDTDYLWVDDRWRVRPPLQPSAVPVQLLLEARDHIDLETLDDEDGAEMGRMILRLERAIRTVGDVGRVHVNRWGDGGSHFHLWFYARPLGDTQMIGFCLPLWAMTLPPTPESEWNRNLAVVADELSKRGGRKPA